MSKDERSIGMNPYLSVSDSKAAMDFYARVFGAVEVGPRLVDPQGSIVHAEIEIGTARVMLSDENPEFGNHSPKSLGGTAVRLNLEVEDADSIAAAAVEAGGEILIPIADQFYGYRSGRIADPFGHEWILSQKLEDLSPAEMQSRMDAMYQQHTDG